MDIPIEHSPITYADFRTVFRVLAGIDGQERGEVDAETWMIAARAGRWTRAQVAAATLALSATWTGYRVQPGHMTEQINRNRQRIRAHWYCPDPPRTLAHDPAAELAWRRWAADDFADRALLALAAGDPLDDVPLTLSDEVPQAVIEERKRRVTRAIGHVAEDHRIPEPPTPAPGRQRDPDRAAAARREIEARRPGPVPAQPGAPEDESRTEEPA